MCNVHVITCIYADERILCDKSVIKLHMRCVENCTMSREKGIEIGKVMKFQCINKQLIRRRNYISDQEPF